MTGQELGLQREGMRVQLRLVGASVDGHMRRLREYGPTVLGCRRRPTVQRIIAAGTPSHGMVFTMWRLRSMGPHTSGSGFAPCVVYRFAVATDDLSGFTLAIRF